LAPSICSAELQACICEKVPFLSDPFGALPPGTNGQGWRLFGRWGIQSAAMGGAATGGLSVGRTIPSFGGIVVPNHGSPVTTVPRFLMNDLAS